MSTNWVQWLMGISIYLQTVGAFIWLGTIVLLELGRRRQRARAAEAEQLLFAHSEQLTALWDQMKIHRSAINGVRLEMNLPALSDHPPDQMPEPEQEQTDPHCRLPSDVEHELPAEVVAVVDFGPDRPPTAFASMAEALLASSLVMDAVGTEVPTPGHWECVRCRQAFLLEDCNFDARCDHCGGRVEMVTYPEQGDRQLATNP